MPLNTCHFLPSAAGRWCVFETPHEARVGWEKKEKVQTSFTIYSIRTEMKSSRGAEPVESAGLCEKSSCFKSSTGLRFSGAFERADGTFSESENSACFSDCSSAWTGRKSSQRLSRSFHPSTLTPKMVGPHCCVFTCWMLFREFNLCFPSGSWNHSDHSLPACGCIWPPTAQTLTRVSCNSDCYNSVTHGMSRFFQNILNLRHWCFLLWFFFSF